LTSHSTVNTAYTSSKEIIFSIMALGYTSVRFISKTEGDHNIMDVHIDGDHTVTPLSPATAL
jgi:hypothetical protein